jgi:hypothetical protein
VFAVVLSALGVGLDGRRADDRPAEPVGAADPQDGRPAAQEPARPAGEPAEPAGRE